MDPYRPMTFDNRPVAPVFLDSNPVTDGVANFAAALMNAGPAANQIREQRAAAELAKMWKDREWERQQAQDKLAALWHQQAQDRQIANDERLGRMTDAQIANLEADNTRAWLTGMSSEGRGWVDSLTKLVRGGGAKGTAKEQKPIDITKRLGEVEKNLGFADGTEQSQKEAAVRAHLEQLEKAGLLTPEDKGLLDFMRLSQPEVTQKPPESGVLGKVIDAGVWTGARAEEASKAGILAKAGNTGYQGVKSLFNAPFKAANVAEKVASPLMPGVQAAPKGKIAATVSKLFTPVARAAVSTPVTLAQGALAVGDLAKYGATGETITGDGETIGNMVAAGIKGANSGFNPEDKESTLNNWAYKNETVDPKILWGSLIANGTIHPSDATPENMKYFLGVVKKLEERQVNGPVRREALKVAVRNFPIFGGSQIYSDSDAKNDTNNAILKLTGDQNAGQ